MKYMIVKKGFHLKDRGLHYGDHMAFIGGLKVEITNTEGSMCWIRGVKNSPWNIHIDDLKPVSCICKE